MASDIMSKALISFNVSLIPRFKFKHFSVRVLCVRHCHANINKDNGVIDDATPSEDARLFSRILHPKGTLHNCYATVAQQLKCSSHKVKPSYQLVRSVGKTEWKCTYIVKWPKEMTFSAVLQNKSLAGKQAALKALHWLKLQGKITETGIPILNAQHGVNESRIPVQISSHQSSSQTDKHPHFTKQNSNTLLEEETAQEDRDKCVTKDESSKELGRISVQFPQPRGTLHNCYATVAQDLKDSSQLLKPSYQLLKGIGGNTEWKCTYKVKWPEEKSFSAVMQSKAVAGKQAALKVLHWLTSGGKVTKTGAPIIYDRKEVEQQRVPIQVVIDHSSSQSIDALLQLYKQKIKPLVEEKMENEREDTDLNDLLGSELLDPVSNLHGMKRNPKSVTRRNEKLFIQYSRRNKEEYYNDAHSVEKFQELPIAQFQSEIVNLVAANRVVIVKGEPGCGKSTQVPQYVFDDWAKRKHGAECNIIVTQPRRISAISLAERVAQERQEKVGDVIGYQVRFKAVLPPPVGGSVLYCSTGILLRRLQNNLGLLGLSHIIVDEAHERDINMDLLMVLLRRALVLNPELRVLVMSATINAEMFQRYFDNAPVLHIPGFTYPVKSHYLEDLKEVKLEQNHTSRDDSNPVVDCKQMVKLIHWIHKSRPAGAILCFLPGWAEIKTLLNLLEDSKNNSLYLVLPVHSKISHDDQRRIFGAPPPGIRKIILATNIAETSITINDVVYVVDSGAHKEERYDLDRGMASLDTQWVSQANVSQRRGRAGRVKPGESFHLFTREKYKSLDDFPIPEIMRIPLEKTVLDCKLYSPSEKATEFLAEMPEPPSSQAVDQAVADLIQLGALDEDEKMTCLGRRIAHFGTHPKLSKALVHAAVFKCISPMTTIATTLSSDKEIFQGGLVDKTQMREAKRRFHPSSDHVALAQLYQHWEMLKVDDVYDARDFCYKMYINMESLGIISKLRRLYEEYLHQSRMLNDAVDITDLQASCNKHAENNELLKAVLLSSLDNVLLMRNWDYHRGRLKKGNIILTECGQRVTIHPKSVNFKREKYPLPFLTCFRQVRSLERRSILVHETTLLSALSVLLFINGQFQISKFKGVASSEETWDSHVLLTVKGRPKIAMVCKESHAQTLLELRTVIWEMVDYFVAVEGQLHDEQYSTVSDFHTTLLNTVATLLCKTDTAIDYKDDKFQR